MIWLTIFCAWVFLMVCGLALFAINGDEPTACTGNCQQGRNCTCGDRDA